MKNKIFMLLCLILSGFICSVESRAQTAQGVLSKAAGEVKGAKGIEVNYTISGQGKSLSGQLKAAGSKFYVKAGGMESWYNGKNLYTYNPNSKETTVVSPTPSELAEINPLLYLNSYASLFEAAFSQNKQTGKYIVDLKAKSRKAPVKKVTIFLNAKSYQPEKFVITSLDGSVATVTIVKSNYGAALSSSVFEYPKGRLPNAQIVDLR